MELDLVPGPEAYGFMLATMLVDLWLLYIFFSRRIAARRSPTLP
jgi:hypothetical protein